MLLSEQKAYLFTGFATLVKTGVLYSISLKKEKPQTKSVV